MDKSREEIFQYLEEVSDPEVPVINVVELGVVRDVSFVDDKILVTITPTYSGCPALKTIEDDIKAKLQEKGLTDFSVKTILSPAWTTDWLTESALQKLKDYGIAPPLKVSPQHVFPFLQDDRTIRCPQCNSANTVMKSHFGSTACKALYICNDCKEPFDYFKCI